MISDVCAACDVLVRVSEYYYIYLTVITVIFNSNDKRRYNAPTASEIAVLLPGDGECVGNRDIVVNKREGDFWKLNEMNGAYDPLPYVLMFP